jgi:hypothetical protein
MDEIPVSPQPTPQPVVKKKNAALSWLLWWQLDNDEINKQLLDYQTLKIYQSARGISFLLLLLSAVITALFIVFFHAEVLVLIDSVLMIIIGLFVLRGHKWAMIAAMILWTFEKLVSLPTNAFVSLLWWALYMHSFYLAYRVEKLRGLVPKTP